MTALDMPTRIGDLLDDVTAHIVVIDPRETCKWTDRNGGPECGATATWDLITACVRGCEAVSHICDRHKVTALSADPMALYCPKHPPRKPLARIVAVYPRRNA